MTVRSVRRAAVNDLGAVVALRAEMFRSMGGHAPARSDWRKEARDWFGARLAQPDVCLVVVTVDEVVVATALGQRRESVPGPSAGSGDVLISNVSTLPAYRRQGHSRVAVSAVMDWARATGAGRVELVATGDGAALYRELGFVSSPWDLMRFTLPPS